MQICLRFLDSLSWCGEPIHGPRSAALLDSLLTAENHGASAAQLIEAIWEDSPPLNPRKALQVLVSRLRSATTSRIIESTPTGYRLGLNRNEVDVLARDDLSHDAHVLYLAGQLSEAKRKAIASLEIGPSPQAQRLFGLTASVRGDHHEALASLHEAAEYHPHDEEVRAALLRSISTVQGPAAAMTRYDMYRQKLMDDLGNSPGPLVQAVHRELLGANQPQHWGVQHDASTLLGRAEDLKNLKQHFIGTRLVTILGPGGIGKTRLAHALSRKAPKPVYFVELAMVGSSEQVIRTVAATLGVRDSRTAQRSLTPAQRSNTKERIAQHLQQTPTLLVLDNCEHVIDAVSGLVAYLLGSVADLQVLTTSRTPLRVAGEHVYPLSQLSAQDAQQLFRERALAGRPGVVLENDLIAELVERLDGLPLAIELAAAQVRVMPLFEITARLTNRFDLLRGGERSAPDRQQTLLAVMEWSWNLLSPAAQNGLMRLSIFYAGFTAPCAEEILGENAGDAVFQLIDQSLIMITENVDGVRYRMLETVREFALIQLRESDLVQDARVAQHRWARTLCAELTPKLHGTGQLSSAAMLRSEETNLSDILRYAFATQDRDTAFTVLSALTSFWTISGDHLRIVEFLDPTEKALVGWDPPAHLIPASRRSLAVLATTAGIIPKWFSIPQTLRVLAHVGPDPTDPFVEAMYLMAEVIHGTDNRSPVVRLHELTAHPQHFVAMLASAMLASHVENAGDPRQALRILTDAILLANPNDGPWLTTNYQMMIAQLYTQIGEPAAAVPHARQALKVLEQFAPLDDAIQCRGILAIAELSSGNIDTAAEVFADIANLRQRGQRFVFGGIVTLGEAELALAQGKTELGVALLHKTLETAPHSGIPNSLDPEMSPWTLLSEGAVLAAFAWHGPAETGEVLVRRVADLALRALDPKSSHHDFPVLGAMLFSIAAWGLLQGHKQPADVSQLLALADRFSYNRFLPSLAWDPVTSRLGQDTLHLLVHSCAALADTPRTELLHTAQQAIRTITSVGNS